MAATVEMINSILWPFVGLVKMRNFLCVLLLQAKFSTATLNVSTNEDLKRRYNM